MLKTQDGRIIEIEILTLKDVGILLKRLLPDFAKFYLPSGDRVMSHTMIKPSEMFGIPRAVDKFKAIKPAKSSLMWNLNAGARNLIALSKIKAKHRYDRLQKSHGIKVKSLIQMEDQWEIFVEIAKQLKADWRTEVLYFSRQWINQLKSPQWLEISSYLMQQQRLSYNIWHNTALIWEAIFHGKSLITLLDQVQFITEAYKKSILNSKNNNQSLYEVASAVEFSFYHSTDNPQTYSNILSTKDIAKEDLRFTQNQSGVVPAHSSFFKGCIKISHI